MKRHVPVFLKRQSHLTSRGDFWFATIPGQLLSGASKWQPHDPMRIPAEYNRRRTICVATANRICVEIPIRPANRVRANDTNTTFSCPKSYWSAVEMWNKILKIMSCTALVVPYFRQAPFRRFWFQRSTYRSVYHAIERRATNRRLPNWVKMFCRRCPKLKCCHVTRRRMLYVSSVYPELVCVCDGRKEKQFTREFILIRMGNCVCMSHLVVWWL